MYSCDYQHRFLSFCGTRRSTLPYTISFWNRAKVGGNSRSAHISMIRHMHVWSAAVSGKSGFAVSDFNLLPVQHYWNHGIFLFANYFYHVTKSSVFRVLHCLARPREVHITTIATEINDTHFVTVVPLLVNRSAPDITLRIRQLGRRQDISYSQKIFSICIQNPKKIKLWRIHHLRRLSISDIPSGAYWYHSGDPGQLNWEFLRSRCSWFIFIINHISTCFKLSIYQLYDVIFYDHSRNAIITVHWSSHRYWVVGWSMAWNNNMRLLFVDATWWTMMLLLYHPCAMCVLL